VPRLNAASRQREADMNENEIDRPECICGDAVDRHVNGNECSVCPCRTYRPQPDECPTCGSSEWTELVDEGPPEQSITICSECGE
jgi:hypothetical protein